MAQNRKWVQEPNQQSSNKKEGQSRLRTFGGSAVGGGGAIGGGGGASGVKSRLHPRHIRGMGTARVDSLANEAGPGTVAHHEHAIAIELTKSEIQPRVLRKAEVQRASHPVQVRPSWNLLAFHKWTGPSQLVTVAIMHEVHESVAHVRTEVQTIGRWQATRRGRSRKGGRIAASPCQQRRLPLDAQSGIFVRLGPRISMVTIAPLVHLLLLRRTSDLEITWQIKECALVCGRRQFSASQVAQPTAVDKGETRCIVLEIPSLLASAAMPTLSHQKFECLHLRVHLHDLLRRGEVRQGGRHHVPPGAVFL